MVVMEALINQALFSSTLFAQASWKLVTPCCSHARPITLNVYAPITPIKAQMADAGHIAPGASLKKAIPEGKDKTPQPTIDFARLNVEVDTVESPPFMLGAAANTAAPPCASSVIEILLRLSEVTPKFDLFA